MNPDLAEERAHCDFDQRELAECCQGPELTRFIEELARVIEQQPEMQSGFDYYEMTRQEKMAVWWKRYKTFLLSPQARHYLTEEKGAAPGHSSWSVMFPGVSPLALH